MAVFLDENGLISALEKMTGPLMALIEELGVDAVQLPHADGKIAVRRFDKEIIVIAHEAIGMTEPIVAFINVLESVQEVNAVLVVFKDGFFIIASRGDMIDSTCIFYAEGTGHAGTLAEKKGNVKIKDLTLRCP
jgi:hypothetical protein